jgi:hypothetical protein
MAVTALQSRSPSRPPVPATMRSRPWACHDVAGRRIRGCEQGAAIVDGWSP